MKKLLFVMIIFYTVSAAQEKYIELYRSDLKTKKVALITEAMQFTEEESAKFWPIYREYELERSNIGDKEIELLKKYAESYESMTDEVLDELAAATFDLDEEMIKLKRKYFNELKSKMSTRIAAKFIQIENQLQSILDFQLSSEIPLID